jgi:hypothetical protein
LILDLEYDLHAFEFPLPDRVSADALAAMGVRNVQDNPGQGEADNAGVEALFAEAGV